ncbi:hypothetical protein Curi_c06960 [Gottschalkia acidurici 9a]|uniref:Adhesin domain-containing protein n=1 Tax=Gottschalkia acidurici (strain ATCC 7906 / DSM 604 / BCRC 14475 / CIP 104303 / KCTC 5404 / NCIMB 10678 / 9a) TaxID=1128398 RepID=K0AX02_GOTA9|nr:hypothetical protein [Gottschalkia acidurici]AFS77769.1 hypothetical protein Curi_c06960 [Gottschalkia acidurici 9a]
MEIKRIVIVCIIVGLISILIAGALYLMGGYKIFNTQDNYSIETKGRKIAKEESIENVESIKIKASISNVYFQYSDEDILKLELINPLKKSEDPIIINNINNTLTVDINKVNKGLNLKNDIMKGKVGSTLKISIPNKYKGDMDITSDIGELEGEYSGKNLNLNTKLGDIDVKINEIESGKIVTDIGEIKLKVNENNNLTFDIKTSVGEIENKLRSTKLNSSDNSFPGMSQKMNFDMNEGGSLIKLESRLGDIEVYN